MSDATKRYPQYPRSSFPEAVESWPLMQDLNAVTYPLAMQYNELLEGGNFEGAATFLSNYPELEKCLYDAEKWNKISDAIKALEQFFGDEVQEYLDHLTNFTIGIDDNVTGDAAGTNTYSALKINELTGIYSLAPIEISQSDWDDSFVYTCTDSNIGENDIVEVYFHSDSYPLVSKAQIRIISDTGAGNFKLQAKKVPAGTIKIDTYKVVKHNG